MFKQSDKELLEKFNNLKTPRDLAVLLEVKYSTITFFQNENRRKKYYRNFPIKKKSGKTRTIHAPQGQLKILLHKINYLLNLLYAPKSSTHGFIKSGKSKPKSIITNALVHTRKKYVFNIDLQDFFPSITKNRIAGLFKAFPFNLSKDIALIIAELCTINSILPQGAPTSPTLSNMICRRMDTQLQEYAKNLKITYTRYADDITFSSSYQQLPGPIVDYSTDAPRVGLLLKQTITKNGFDINGKKVRLQNNRVRQEVTGLVVNKRVNIKRSFIRNLRAVLHDWENNGKVIACNNYYSKQNSIKKKKPSNPNFDFEKVIRGKIGFVGMIRGNNDYIYARLANKINKITNKKTLDLPENRNEWIESNLWVLESNSSTSTAFTLADGKVISCAHGIEGKDGLKAFKASQHKITYPIAISAIASYSTGFDVSKIEINSPIKSIGFQTGDPQKIKPGAKVTIAGFGTYSPEGTPRIFPAEITSIKSLKLSVYNKQTNSIEDINIKKFVLSKHILTGDSGGAILNDEDKVIGIAVKGIDPSSKNEFDASSEAISIEAIKYLDSSFTTLTGGEDVSSLAPPDESSKTNNIDVVKIIKTWAPIAISFLTLILVIFLFFYRKI